MNICSSIGILMLIGVCAREAMGADPAPKTKPAGDTLKFFNGDKLHGSLVRIDVDGNLLWRNPAAAGDTEFKTVNVAEIRFASSPPSKNKAMKLAVVHLTNSDKLIGQVLSLDSDNLLLETTYAGQLAIKRNAISSIVLGRATPAIVYAGPEGMDGWKSKTETWQYTDEALVLPPGKSGSISRDVGLPAVAQIEFDLSWKQYPSLSVQFYHDMKSDLPGNHYTLQLSNGNISLQKNSQKGGTTTLGQAQVPALSQSSQTQITIRASTEIPRTIYLLVSGEQIGQWSDRSADKLGTGLAFAGRGRGGLKVREIKVSAWDGTVDSNNPDTSTKRAEDALVMSNTDIVSGRLESIRGGEVSLTSSYASWRVPVTHLTKINFVREKPTPPTYTGSEVRAYFDEKHYVTFLITGWSDKGLSAKHDAFGEASFPISSFQRLQFHLDRKPSVDDELSPPLNQQQFPFGPGLDFNPGIRW